MDKNFVARLSIIYDAVIGLEGSTAALAAASEKHHQAVDNYCHAIWDELASLNVMALEAPEDNLRDE